MSARLAYRKEIDGLRAVAVVPVILFHAGLTAFGGGYVGVDVFFVISGYLITSILINDLERGDFSISRFYERRARRILPALFLVMAACLPFAYAWMSPPQVEDFARSLVSVIFFVSNIFFWREEGYFAAAAELKPLLHTWSLSVEEQFYLVIPIFLYATWRFGRSRVFWLVVAFSAASLLLCDWASRNTPSANFYLTPTRTWELLAGSICAFLTAGRPQRKSDALSAIGMGLILLSVFAFDKDTPFPSLYALAPVAGTALVILYGTQGTLVANLLSARPFLGIGLISYSAYLWHQPLFAFARLRSVDHPNIYLMLALSLVALLLAWLTWRFVERPFRTKSTSLSDRRRIFLASGAGGALFIAIGVYGHHADGNILNKHDPRAVALFDRIQSENATWRNKHRLRLQDFPDDGDRNLLVIGDSQSGDLLNALLMAFGEQYNYSSVTILAGCGNLYLENTSFDGLPGAKTALECAHGDWYHQRVKALIEKADHVFLASAWRQFEADLFADSWTNLTAEFGDKFFALGSIAIEYDQRSIFDSRFDALQNATYPQLPDVAAVNTTIGQVAGDRFIDPAEIFCEARRCGLFMDGDAVFYDGYHYTQHGTAILSRWLHDWAGEALM